MHRGTFLFHVALSVGFHVSLAVAYFRMPCQGVLGLGRIDPIISPGAPSSHVHSLVGGRNVGFSSTPESLLKANCTSCEVAQDRSVYWTPVLYFQHANDSLELVEQIFGMNVYYFQRNDTLGTANIHGFPAGFAVVAGNNSRRTFDQPVPDPPVEEWTPFEKTQSALQQKSTGFNCLNFDKAEEVPLSRHFLPEKSYLDANCPNGLRLELAFPSCWNGKDLSSPDQTHVAYPDYVQWGSCPEGYPVRLPTLFYDSYWNTEVFKGINGRFLLSNGDTTGYSFHGDFMMGWEPELLQSAIDQCQDDSGDLTACPVFKDLQTQEQQLSCKLTMPKALLHENPLEPGDILLGDDPVTGVNGVLIGGEPPLPSSSAKVPLSTTVLAHKSVTVQEASTKAKKQRSTRPTHAPSSSLHSTHSKHPTHAKHSKHSKHPMHANHSTHAKQSTHVKHHTSAPSSATHVAGNADSTRRVTHGNTVCEEIMVPTIVTEYIVETVVAYKL